MDNKISESENSSSSKKDPSSSEDMTVTKLKTLAEKCSDLTIRIFREEPDCHYIMKSSEESTHKVRQISGFYIASVLVMTTLVFGVGFGLGWWCGRFNPDMSPYKLNTKPFGS